MITKIKGSYSIKELCEALGGSRSGYHAAWARPAAPRLVANEKLLVSMQAIHSHRPTRAYGSPRMAKELQATGSPGSLNRVARVMQAAGLRVEARALRTDPKPRRPITPRPLRQTSSPRLLPPRSPALIW